MEYYLVIKRNELFIHGITWMSLQVIMLSERSQKKKSNTMITFIYNSRKCKLIGSDRKPISVDGT